MLNFAHAIRLFSKGRAAVSVVAAVAVAALLTLGLAEPAAALPTTGSFNLTLNSWTGDAVNPGTAVQDAYLELYHFNTAENSWENVDTNGDSETNSSGQLPSDITGLVVGDKYAVQVVCLVLRRSTGLKRLAARRGPGRPHGKRLQ